MNDDIETIRTTDQQTPAYDDALDRLEAELTRLRDEPRWDGTFNGRKVIDVFMEYDHLQAEVERAYGDAETYRSALNRAEAVENTLAAKVDELQAAWLGAINHAERLDANRLIAEAEVERLQAENDGLQADLDERLTEVEGLRAQVRQVGSVPHGDGWRGGVR
jgi:uncharacterized protein YukE